MEMILKELKSKLTGLRFDEILAPYTTYKIGGPAKYFFVARDNQSVAKAIRLARENDIAFFILGNGSNILIADKGFNGLVIKMENNKIITNELLITAESGVLLQKLVRDAVTKSLTGLEFLFGIPGTVGGGIAGNVGTPSEWIGEKVQQVEIFNAQNEIETIPKSQCDFSYRFSRFKYDDKEVILSVTFNLQKSDQTQIQSKISEYASKRSLQPVKSPSAGSVFKNPDNKKAWQIIDEAGLRGMKMGGAQVSKDHANFIINTGNAKAEDVVILISYIKQQIRDQFGIQLQEEIKYIGF
jgi:UDP-N-acetylmuramate dehydrogenase